MTNQNSESIHNYSRKHRIGRKLSRFLKKLLFHLVFWLLAVLLVAWMASVFFVRPAAKTAISKLCGDAAVYIESARIKGLAEIRLKGVIIAENPEALSQAPIMQCDKIDVSFNPLKLLKGNLEPSSIRLSDFLFNATYEAPKQWNFLCLLPTAEKVTPRFEKMPFIEIHNGILRISRIENGRPEPITMVSLNGQIATRADEAVYHFLATSAEKFGFTGTALRGSLTRGDADKKSRLVVQGKIQMPKAKIFENSWNLDDVQLDCEFDRDQIVLNRCEFSMGQGELHAEGSLQWNADSGQELNVDVNCEHFNLSDHYVKNALVYSEPVLKLLAPKVQTFLTRYHPGGTGDVELSIQGQLKDLSAIQVAGTIRCRDISVLDKTFPYRLDHIRGDIIFSGRSLAIDGLTAEHNDVRLLVKGKIENWGPNAQFDVQAASDNMQFDKDLYDALNEPLKKVWHSFAPEGTTGVNYHFRRYPDGKKDITLTLDLKNVGLVYEHFPYPLENLTGTIIMKPDSVVLHEVVSHYEDGRRVILNGNVLEIQKPKLRFQINIDAKEIPVNSLLIDAMPSRHQEFLNKLDIEAVADMQVDVFSDVTGEGGMDYIAKIQVAGKHLIYEQFPLPIENISLVADVTQERVRLHHFEGTAGGGQIAMNGVLEPTGFEPARPGLCLELELQNFDFNETFWNAADETAERVLGKLRFGGPMEVRGHLAVNQTENSCSPTNLSIVCSDNPVSWDSNSLGLASGELRLSGQTVYFEDFELDGIQTQNVPDELLQGQFKNIYDGIQPHGELQFLVRNGTLRMDKRGLERINVNGSAALKNMSAGHEKVINELNGRIAGHLEINRPKKIWQASGSCDIDHFNYRHWSVSDVQADFVHDPNTLSLEGTNVLARFYGGQIKGDIRIDLSGEEQINYELGLSLKGIDVPRLPAVDEEDFSEHVKQGLASGELTLQGDLRTPSQSHGEATVHVIDMQLGNQSVIGKILTAMQFKQPEEYVFSEFRAKTAIQGHQLLIEDIRMVGKPLVFRGTGKLDLKQKQIEIDWVAYDRLMGSEDTILDKLARGIGSAIWKIEVRGKLDDPQIEAMFLSVLKQPLDFFKKKD